MSQAEILFEKALDNANIILKLTGLQLIDNTDPSLLKRLRRRLYIIIVLVVINPLVIAECAWFVNAAMSDKELVEITYPAPAITHCFLGNLKAYIYLKNEHRVNDLISTLRKLQAMTVKAELSTEVEKELKSRTKFLTKATNIQYWLNVVSIGAFAILPFITMGISYTETGEIELLLPFVILYPFFDVYDKHIYPFMYMHEMFAATMIVFLVLGPDCIYYLCATFIQIQFRYLRYDLERVVTRNPSEIRLKQQIAVCIKRHRYLIRCVSIMEQSYAKSTLFNVVSSSMLICLTLFNLTASPSKTLMMPFVGFVLLVSSQIFLFCYFGDIIKRSSMAISDGVYNCKWYNIDTKVKKDLLFILLRSGIKRPIGMYMFCYSCSSRKVVLGHFVVAWALMILSTAWSYFALLSTVNGDDKPTS